MAPGRRALEAWDAWKAGHDLIETELDHGSFRLLALVYRNLLTQGADEPLMPRLKGIYRYWWCSNQRLFYRAAGVIRQLESAGIRTIVNIAEGIPAEEGDMRQLLSSCLLLCLLQHGRFALDANHSPRGLCCSRGDLAESPVL